MKKLCDKVVTMSRSIFTARKSPWDIAESLEIGQHGPNGVGGEPMAPEKLKALRSNPLTSN